MNLEGDLTVEVNPILPSSSRVDDISMTPSGRAEGRLIATLMAVLTIAATCDYVGDRNFGLTARGGDRLRWPMPAGQGARCISR
jgi:hypothetical protein